MTWPTTRQIWGQIQIQNTFDLWDIWWKWKEETLLDQPKDNLYRDNTQICEHISDIWDLDSEQSLSVSDSGPIPNTTPSPFLNKIQRNNKIASLGMIVFILLRFAITMMGEYLSSIHRSGKIEVGGIIRATILTLLRTFSFPFWERNKASSHIYVPLQTIVSSDWRSLRGFGTPQF